MDISSSTFSPSLPLPSLSPPLPLSFEYIIFDVMLTDLQMEPMGVDLAPDFAVSHHVSVHHDFYTPDLLKSVLPFPPLLCPSLPPSLLLPPSFSSSLPPPSPPPPSLLLLLLPPSSSSSSLPFSTDQQVTSQQVHSGGYKDNSNGAPRRKSCQIPKLASHH